LDPRLSRLAPHLLETRSTTAVEAAGSVPRDRHFPLASIGFIVLSHGWRLALRRTRGTSRNSLAVTLSNAIGNLAAQAPSFGVQCALRKLRRWLSIGALRLERPMVDPDVQTGLPKCLVRQSCPPLA
jgi:hypothetical protein